MAVLLSVIRAIHVFGAVIWAGVAFVNYAWLGPAVRASGPAGGTVMGRIARSSLPRAMVIMPILTVLSGLVLYWVYSGHLNTSWIFSWKGIALSVGALTGLAAFFEGMFITGPTVDKIGKLGAEMQAAGGPPQPEQLSQMQALQAKLESATARGAIFLAISVVGMSLGAA